MSRCSLFDVYTWASTMPTRWQDLLPRPWDLQILSSYNDAECRACSDTDVGICRLSMSP